MALPVSPRALHRALTFPGLVITISCSPRNAGPGLDATIPLAPWCQGWSHSCHLKGNRWHCHPRSVSPAGTGDSGLIRAGMRNTMLQRRQQDYLQHQNEGWNAGRLWEVRAAPVARQRGGVWGPSALGAGRGSGVLGFISGGIAGSQLLRAFPACPSPVGTSPGAREGPRRCWDRVTCVCLWGQPCHRLFFTGELLPGLQQQGWHGHTPKLKDLWGETPWLGEQSTFGWSEPTPPIQISVWSTTRISRGIITPKKPCPARREHLAHTWAVCPHLGLARALWTTLRSP